jgi:multisubunit Na+/H+ antiporter MnhC subunit
MACLLVMLACLMINQPTRRVTLVILSFAVTLFIIIIGKTEIPKPCISSEESARQHQAFTSLDSATILFFFFCRGRSSALRPTPNLGDQVSVFMSLSDSMAQLYSHTPEFPFHRRLRLSPLRWGSSNLPPKGVLLFKVVLTHSLFSIHTNGLCCN